MKSTLAKCLLDYLYKLHPEELLKEGFPSDLVSMLHQHTMAHRATMERISKYCTSFEVTEEELKISIPFKQLRLAQARVEQAEEERKLENEFISKGASRVCMKALFDMSKYAFLGRKKLLGCEEATGRPSLQHKQKIAVLWTQMYASEMDERAKLLTIHEVTGVPIAAIWSIVNDVEAKHPGCIFDKDSIDSLC